jgi:hypothetical protein
MSQPSKQLSVSSIAAQHNLYNTCPRCRLCYERLIFATRYCTECLYFSVNGVAGPGMAFGTHTTDTGQDRTHPKYNTYILLRCQVHFQEDVCAVTTLFKQHTADED